MRGKLLFVLEIVIVAAVFFLDWVGILPVSKKPYLFLLGWVSLGIRGLRWRDVGLKLDQPFLKLLAIGAVVGIAMEALELFATQPLLTKLLHQGPDLHELQRLVGNTQLLIVALVFAWLVAAFGEE